MSPWRKLDFMQLQGHPFVVDTSEFQIGDHDFQRNNDCLWKINPSQFHVFTQSGQKRRFAHKSTEMEDTTKFGLGVQSAHKVRAKTL